MAFFYWLTGVEIHTYENRGYITPLITGKGAHLVNQCSVPVKHTPLMTGKGPPSKLAQILYKAVQNLNGQPKKPGY